MISGIGGIGSLPLKPEIGGADATTDLFQGTKAPMAGGEIGTTFAEALRIQRSSGATPEAAISSARARSGSISSSCVSRRRCRLLSM